MNCTSIHMHNLDFDVYRKQATNRAHLALMFYFLR